MFRFCYFSLVFLLSQAQNGFVLAQKGSDSWLLQSQEKRILCSRKSQSEFPENRQNRSTETQSHGVFPFGFLCVSVSPR